MNRKEFAVGSLEERGVGERREWNRTVCERGERRRERGREREERGWLDAVTTYTAPLTDHCSQWNEVVVLLFLYHDL